MVEEQIKKLAESMNVSPSDVRCFMQGIINGMVQDDVAERYVQASLDGQDELVSALLETYAEDAVKRMRSFANLYNTNTVFQDQVRLKVYSLITGK